MSEESDDPITDASGDALRQEASEWFVRMRGADAEQYRSEFEAWIRRGALHRAAYNSVAATFAMGKKVRREDLAGDVGAVRTYSARMRLALLGGLAVLLLAAVSAGWLFHAHFAGRSQPYADGVPSRTEGAQPIGYSTGKGEVRAFRLVDGSRLVLDVDSEVTGEYSQSERILRLLRGRARFEVAHDGRSFVVRAGSGSVTARGTVFDVEIVAGQSFRVNLLQGAVDVGGGAANALRLAAGQSLTFGATPSNPVRFSQDSVGWTSGRMSFENATVADILEQTNNRSSARVVVESADISALRVSGSFRIVDGAIVAERLAHLFDLIAEPTEDGTIMLRRRR